MAEPVVIGGIIGAAAALGGVAVTGAVNVWIDGRKADRERKQREEDRGRSRLAAARLIEAELYELRAALRGSLARKRWWTSAPPTEAWDQQRLLLAGEPDELKEWDFVAVAYGQLRLILGTPRAPNQEFIEGDEWGLNRLEQNTQRALVELTKLTKRQSAAATP